MDLGNWLNGKMVLYLNDLANPKNGLNLVPTRCSARTLGDCLTETRENKTFKQNEKINFSNITIDLC